MTGLGWCRGFREYFCVSKPPRRRSLRSRTGLPGAETLEDRRLLSAAGFDPGTVDFNTDVATDTVIQSDGKIVIVGAAQNSIFGGMDFAIARLNSDGTPDVTFGVNGKTTVPFDGGGNNLDVATSVALTTGGKILIGGYFERGNGDFDFGVARLNPDGSIDASFSGDGRATVAFNAGGDGDDRATSMAVMPDGRIVLGGYAQRNSRGNYDFAVARLTADGELDTTFSSDGLKLISFNYGGQRDDRAQAITLQENGAIILAGYAQRSSSGNFDFAVARVSVNGNMDTTFNKVGKRTIRFNLGGAKDDRATSVEVVGNRIVLGGYAQVDGTGNYDFAVARITMGGTLDDDFNQDGTQTVAFDFGLNNDDRAFDMTVQSDGRLYLIGRTELNDAGDTDIAIARITTNGSLDRTFGFDEDGKVRLPFDILANGADSGSALAVDDDGTLVVVGSTKVVEPNDTDFAIARLQSDGLLDSLFGSAGITTLPFDLMT